MNLNGMKRQASQALLNPLPAKKAKLETKITVAQEVAKICQQILKFPFVLDYPYFYPALLPRAKLSATDTPESKLVLNLLCTPQIEIKTSDGKSYRMNSALIYNHCLFLKDKWMKNQEVKSISLPGSYSVIETIERFFRYSIISDQPPNVIKTLLKIAEILESQSLYEGAVTITPSFSSVDQA